MGNGLNPKEVEAKLLGVFVQEIESAGFIKYKGKQFVKLKGEVLLFVQIFPNKKDVYIWFSAHPLVQNDINLGRGVIADRYPSEEGSLVVSDEGSLNSIEKALVDGVQFAVAFLDRKSSLSQICSNASTSLMETLVMSFCFARLNMISDAKNCADTFINSGLDFAETRNGALALLESLQTSTHQEYLNSNLKINIRKLKLSNIL